MEMTAATRIPSHVFHPDDAVDARPTGQAEENEDGATASGAETWAADPLPASSFVSCNVSEHRDAEAVPSSMAHGQAAVPQSAETPGQVGDDGPPLSAAAGEGAVAPRVMCTLWRTYFAHAHIAG